MKKGLSNLLMIILSVFLLGSREKEMDKYYERPDWLAGSVYDVLQKKGNYTLFLEGVERTGYKEMLAGYGLCTVFAPDDDAFSAYLKALDYSGLEAIPEDSLSMLISRIYLLNFPLEVMFEKSKKVVIGSGSAQGYFRPVNQYLTLQI